MSTTTFSLANRGLKLDTAADIEPHVSALKSSTDITHIDLSGNTLGVGACEALAPLIKSQSQLSSIDLHDIFTGRLVEEIPPALDHLLSAVLELKHCTYIDLNDNAFGLKTKEPLVKFLAAHAPLQHLILNNNGMGPIAGASIAEALTALAKRKQEVRDKGEQVPDLETVVCGRNRLENGSMTAWAAAYRAHTGIKSVRMTQNGIRPEGIAVLISEGLAHCEKLEVFDLQDNTFTLKGATALAGAVVKWSGLKELGVGDDLLGKRGAVKVFEALGKGGNKGLELLRLEFNDITPEGVKALVGAAKELPSLRRVELNGNKFEEDDDGVEELRSLLEERKDEKGTDKDLEDHWGIGELDELEGEDEDEDDEDEEDEEEVEEEDVREKTLKEADQAENANVSQKKDADVDDLADVLSKTKV